MEGQDLERDLELPTPKIPRVMVQFTVSVDSMMIGGDDDIEMKELNSMIMNTKKYQFLFLNGELIMCRDNISEFNLVEGRSNSISFLTKNESKLCFEIHFDGKCFHKFAQGPDLMKPLRYFFVETLREISNCPLELSNVHITHGDKDVEFQLTTNEVVSLFGTYGFAIKPFYVTTSITIKYKLHHPMCFGEKVKKIDIPVRSCIKDLLEKIDFEFLDLDDWEYECRGEKIDIDASLFPSYYKNTIDIKFVPIAEKRYTCYASLPSASKFASNSSLDKFRDIMKKLYFQGNPICDHRNTFQADDVSIYHTGFHRFVENCETVTIDEKDYSVVYAFCLAMARTYDLEEERVKNAYDFFKWYVCDEFKMRQSSTSAEADISLAHVCLIEVKNEEGSTDCNAFREVTRYYIADLGQSHRNPAFLVQLIGPNLTIFGAVHGQYICIDRLLPTLWLVPHHKQPNVMIHIVKVLKAFKMAITSLLRDFHSNPPLQPRYPEFCSFGDDVIEYTRYIQPHIFEGLLQKTATKVVVKFTETYGEGVHYFLNEKGHAPGIHHIGPSGRFKVIVMDLVQDGIHIDEFINDNDQDSVENVKIQCENILDLLHNQHYVHGDFRDGNLLVDKCGRVNVIDYEWAGEEGRARYPWFLNHVDLKWPEGASDGMPILHEHDCYWITKLFQN